MMRYLTRVPGMRRLWRKFPVGRVDLRTAFDVWPRPAYAYGTYRAAELAKALAIRHITVIEFGVAGGEGLVALENCADDIGAHFGVGIQVFGFDRGSEGMPAALDYRDLPYVWSKDFYRMDEQKLRARLSTAELVLGDVAETIPLILRRIKSPIGFISFDLDYYHSTMNAFAVFDGPPTTRLPRVFCYFDDMVCPERACYSEFTGELAAIRDFNARGDRRKMSQLVNLRWLRHHPQAWNDQMFCFHDFDHPLYCVNITPSSDEYTQLKLVT
ncbi:MAG TPA: hypothetical protein VFA89_24835 [Terriglobales bacterium]|nr:hypothetical protein [Terriglobales bacterium]